VGRHDRPELTRSEVDRVRELYVNESADLHRYARSRPGVDVHGAEDLVQTAFREAITAWDKVGLLTPDEQRRWLRRVLSNRSIDDWRKRCVVDPTPDVPETGPPEADPGDVVVLTAALRACWARITRMSPVKQEIAFLIWERCWTTERVAGRLGIAETTVRGHLMVVRARLRADLGHLLSFVDDEEGTIDEP